MNRKLDADRMRELDRAILSGRSSHEIAVGFGIRESVRKIRRILRERGQTIVSEGTSSNVNRNNTAR